VTKSFGFDNSVIAQYAQDIKSITELGVQVAIVIGGGNIYAGMNEAETGSNGPMAIIWGCWQQLLMEWPCRQA
jgi:uridylate kinase